MAFGDNLSTFKNVQVLSSQTAQGLQDILQQIQLPFAILSLYAQGNRHYAWINPSKPVKVVKRKSKVKRTKIGNTTTETTS